MKKKDSNWKTLPNVMRENWNNEYYMNLTEEDIKGVINLEEFFIDYEFEVEKDHCDLYFWGIKK